MSPRIDVHHHIVPPDYVAGLPASVSLTPVIKSWSVERTLDDMDRGGVSRSIVTVTTPGFWFGDRAQTQALVRASNEYAAQLVQRHPGRFGLFVMLPLPDLEASLREIEYGLDRLGGAGIALFTNYRDKWIGDPAFDQVFAELHRRRALVHVHPDSPDCCRNIGKPHFGDSMIEYGTDTSRAIGHVLFSGTAHRYPGIRFIWSHAGGTMPFIIERFTREPLQNPGIKPCVPDGVLHELKRFLYDTAQASHAGAMSSLTRLVPVSQILFGSDFPYRTSLDHVKGLAGCGCFSEAELRAIDCENFERVAAPAALARGRN
jgi:predicted TIM-barrel fold metal-dependent hydrolase